ncbi:hypothetical protein GGI21_005234, partial [Coemansia aciculifera]
MNTKIQIATLALAALAAAAYQEAAPAYDNSPAEYDSNNNAPAAPAGYAYYPQENEEDHYGRATEESNTSPGSSAPGESSSGPGESSSGP